MEKNKHSPDGKTAFVTGAASGIGRAIAETLAHNGAFVICADINPGLLEGTVKSLTENGNRALALVMDVSNESDWDKASGFIKKEAGSLDILVNCAGIASVGTLGRMELSDWRRVMAVNLDGVFLGTRMAIRMMDGKGSIINISSATGIRGASGASAYSCSKAAVCMLGKVAAKECAESGSEIRVNTVCPGGVDTPIWDGIPFFREMVEKTGSRDTVIQGMAGNTIGKRFASPAEIAQAVLYLTSDASAFVTGMDFIIDGGFTA